MRSLLKKQKIPALVVLLAFLAPASLLGQEALVLASREETLINRFAEGVLTEAYGRLGIKVSFAAYPGARSVLEADQGRADGEVARLESILQHYPNLQKVSVPLFHTELSAFIHKDFSKPITGWDSLMDCRTTTILGFKYVQDKLAGSTLDVVEDSQTAI